MSGRRLALTAKYNQHKIALRCMTFPAEVKRMAKVQMSLRVDPVLVRKAQRALRARTKTEVVERALSAVVEIAEHRRLIRQFSGTGKPSDFRER